MFSDKKNSAITCFLTMTILSAKYEIGCFAGSDSFLNQLFFGTNYSWQTGGGEFHVPVRFCTSINCCYDAGHNETEKPYLIC
jgi:hypothetical protein